MKPYTDDLSAKDVLEALSHTSEPWEEGYPKCCIDEDPSILGRAFNGYAPPNFWGAWQTIASHIGSVSYSISYTAIGDTLVMGQVRYYNAANGGQQVIEEFRDSTSITTSNSVANVEVRFRGTPLGSAVRGIINP